ncbi:MAG TPA: transposase [Verrucomicrobiae bacterium]|jgi:REP element-mobilizing transposase RayT
MARKLRVEYPGAVYHVLNRGDRGEPIFKDDTDRSRFLQTLGQACEKTGWQIHAWCLMENHFHLVIETPKANLVAGMKWLLGVYTTRFNLRHKLFGHLFSGRYKALVVDGSGTGYLKTVCDYVHLNPIRANLVSAEHPLKTFCWSSYSAYLHKPAKRPPWLRVEKLFGEHGIPRDSAAGRQHFESRMERQRAIADTGHWRPMRRGWYLGEEEFRKELLAQMKERRGENHYGQAALETDRQHAETLVQTEIKKLGWRETDLSRYRKGDTRKAKIAQRLRRETPMTMKWIAHRLKMGTAGSLANSLRALEMK